MMLNRGLLRRKFSKNIDSYLKKHTLSDADQISLAVNYSIIKHNEFKSLSRKDKIKPTIC